MVFPFRHMPHAPRVTSGVLKAQGLGGIRWWRDEGAARRRRQQGAKGHGGNEDGLQTQVRLQLFPWKTKIWRLWTSGNS